MSSAWNQSEMPSPPQAARLKRTHTAVFQNALSSILTSAPSSPSSRSECSSTSSSSGADWDRSTTPPPSPSPMSNPRKRRLSSPTPIETGAVALDLIFGHGPQAEHSQGPPAFFPSQRVAFSPKLRVLQRRGLKLDGDLLPAALRKQTDSEVLTDDDDERMCGMMLGVTGVVEVLSPNKNGPPTVKNSRLIADFVTSLNNGCKIWQRDAALVVEKREYACCSAELTCEHRRKAGERARLPSGTYVLPLSMKIPASDRLPPSFESEFFRLRYTMTLAVFSITGPEDTGKKPSILASVHIPFQILPSTIPTIAPTLPTLTHSPAIGLVPTAALIFNSVAKFVQNADAKEDEAIKLAMSEWHVETHVPTSTYNPSEVTPITLTLRPPITSVACTGVQHIFIRLTLLRRLYVRESSSSLRQENEWGFGMGVIGTEDHIMERHEKDETELCQRWGILTLPASSTLQSATHTILHDIQLPVASMAEEVGYSTALDLTPGAGRPSLVHGESSWFSPTVQDTLGPQNKKFFDKHVHVSSRFSVSVEIGFASGPSPIYQQYGSPLGEFVIRSIPSPFAPRRPMPSNKPIFKGNLRELLVPITVGSVAEPASLNTRLAVGLSRDTAQSGSATPISGVNPRAGGINGWRGEARGPTSLGEDSTTSLDENGVPIMDSWICPPPVYADALLQTPAYQA